MKNKILYLVLLFIILPCAYLKAADEATMQAEQWFLKTDKQVNDLYQKVMSKLDKKQKNALEEAQQAWIAYRKKESAASAMIPDYGGSAYNMDYMATSAELNEERVKVLEKFLKSLTVKP